MHGETLKSMRIFTNTIRATELTNHT